MRVAERPRVVLLEWLDPPFSCGHWSPELVHFAGGDEGIGRAGQPSRTLTWDEVVDARPDAVVVACCGFSLDRTLQDVPALASCPAWTELPAVRSGRVYVVDSLEILAHAIHPNVHPLPRGLNPARQLSPAELGTTGAVPA